GFSSGEDRSRILYTVNDGGYTRPHALDARTFAELPLPPLPAADHVSFGSTTSDGRYTAVVFDSATTLPSSAVLDWATGTLTRWHVPSAPEVDPSRFAPATLESYPARDGAPIPMFVRRPASCARPLPGGTPQPPGPCPVVVGLHGGPGAQAEPGFDPRAQLLVDAGFVYVTPNVRVRGGIAKAWLHSDDGTKRLGGATETRGSDRWHGPRGACSRAPSAAGCRRARPYSPSPPSAAGRTGRSTTSAPSRATAPIYPTTGSRRSAIRWSSTRSSSPAASADRPCRA